MLQDYQCRKCGSRDIQRVKAVVDAGTVSGSSSSYNFNVGTISTNSYSQSDLAKKLSLPNCTLLELIGAILGWGVLALIVGGVTGPEIGLGTFAVLTVLMFVYYVLTKIERHKRLKTFHDEWYCHTCGEVFLIPTETEEKERVEGRSNWRWIVGCSLVVAIISYTCRDDLGALLMAAKDAAVPQDQNLQDRRRKAHPAKQDSKPLDGVWVVSTGDRLRLKDHGTRVTFDVISSPKLLIGHGELSKRGDQLNGTFLMVFRDDMHKIRRRARIRGTIVSPSKIDATTESIQFFRATGLESSRETVTFKLTRQTK